MDKLPYGKSSKQSSNLGSVKYNPTTIIIANDINPNDSILGPYYLDLTNTMIDYSNFTYGEFDHNGVPMTGWGEKATYSPVNIAQFGFIVHDLWLKNKNEEYLDRLKNILNWFEQNKVEFKESFVWTNKNKNFKYNIEGGFVSGMTIGEVISFYLRMYQITDDKSLLDTAKKAFTFFEYTYDEGGVKRYDTEGYLWLEEFPSKKPSYVLNGFIYAFYGILDLYRVTGEAHVKKMYDDCLNTLINNVHKYDCGYWSVYDQLKKELVMEYYQKNVHVPQLDSLYIITKETIFKKYKNKWQKNLNPTNILFVKIMYRLKPRLFFLK